MTTIDFYQTYAKDFFSQTINVDMQNVYQPFLERLPNGKQTILDVGCGSGCDSIFLPIKALMLPLLMAHRI